MKKTIHHYIGYNQNLSQILIPKTGYLYNSNNTPYSATAPEENLKPQNFDATMGIESWETNRSKRFMELVSQYQKVSYDDIELVKLSKDALPESVNCYGASNHPDSPHYSDQMELFSQQKTKKMTLDKNIVLKEAKRIYHPL